tara:strand:+ start:661 stop:1377 length:717 start_codon:yes stop_codon:yes gene_type:complete
MQSRTYDKEKISFTLARLKKGGENFEVVISDVDKALALRVGKPEQISEIVQSTDIFEDANKGKKASPNQIKSILKTPTNEEAISKIIKEGELHLTAEQRKRLAEEKRNKVIEHIQRNAVDPRTGNPHPRQRIELAMDEAKINIDFTDSIETQIEKVISAIRTIIPLSFDKIRITINIPATYSGSAYSALKNKFHTFKKENWNNDGSVTIEIEVIGGAKADLYSLINKLTNGEAEIKEQ